MENVKRVLSVGMSNCDLEVLQVLSSVDRTTVGEQFRVAVRRYIASRAKEKKFRRAKTVAGEKQHLVSVRMGFSSDHLEKLSALSVIDRSTLGGEICTAVRRYVASRAKEKAFKKELRAKRRRELDLLKALTGKHRS